MVELGNESEADSLLSEGGVPNRDVEHIIQDDERDEIIKRRDTRYKFREMSRLNHSAI